MCAWYFRMSVAFILLAASGVVMAGSPVETALPKTAEPDASLVYKQVPEAALSLFIFRPEGWTPADRRPAFLFFFGGGWSGGSPRRLMPFARHFAELGMVGICADYRVKSRHGAMPAQCVEDAKSAVRWLRLHATEQGIDPHRIVVGGDSAGGHLAASTAMISGFEAPNESTEISSAADALILFNPVLDAVAEERNDGRVGGLELARKLSPNHQIRPHLPPALVLHGTSDKRVPFRQAEIFAEQMKLAGNDVVLWPARGGEHSFWVKSPWREDVLTPMEGFLMARGFLPASSPQP